MLWCFLFWPYYAACRILVPQPGIKPVPLAVEVQSPNYWITREDPFRSVQSLNRVWLFRTPWTAGHKASLSITNSWSLLKLMSIESVMPSNHLILCRPLLLLPSILPSIRVFSNELALHIRWPKYWSFSFSISPSNEYSGLISFRIDWFDPLRRPLRCSLNIFLLKEPSHELADNSKNWLSPGKCRFHLQADLFHLTVPCGKMEWSSHDSMAQEKLALLGKSPRDSAYSPEKWVTSLSGL